MALHWRPVGPEPAQTYWQRRAVVALVALAALLLLVLALRALSGGGSEERLAEQGAPAPSPAPTGTSAATPTATATSTPTATASASATASGTASPTASGSATPTASASAPATPTPTASGPPCTDALLDVEAAAEQETYPTGASPGLELRVTNTGAAPCSLDLGQVAVELVVVSGADRIWSSDDCAPGGDADLTVLEPGAIEVSRVTWPGTRSRPGCDGARARALPGTYRVQARVGDLRVQGEPFLLR